MSMTPNGGVGLKPQAGPQGLRIATSPFTSQPDTEVAAVDIYDIQNPGVINSFQEPASGDDSFFGKIKNAISGAVGDVGGGLKSLASSAKGVMAAVKAGTATIRAVTNVASRAMSAVNQIRNGGIMGSINGLSSLAGMAGVTGAGSLASMARGVAINVQRGGIGGALGAAGILTGDKTGSFNQLAGNVNAIERLASRGFSTAGGLNGILSQVDYTVGLTASTISSLDKTSQLDFTKGYDAVMGHASISGKALSQSTLGKVYTAVSDLTSAAADKVSTSFAGVAAGLVTVGSNNGDNSIYSSLVNKGLDKNAAFNAGTAVSSLAARSGNIGVLADISSVDIGRQALGSNPYALQATVRNLTPDVNNYNKPLKDVFDQIDKVATSTGQSWRTSTRGGVTITDSSCTAGNSYTREVIAARAAADHFASPRLTAENATTATVTQNQVLHASASTRDYMMIIDGKEYNIYETNPELFKDDYKYNPADSW